MAQAPLDPARDLRVAVIGSGFSGLGTAIRLMQQGIDDFLVFERGRRGRRHLARQHLPGAAPAM